MTKRAQLDRDGMEDFIPRAISLMTTLSMLAFAAHGVVLLQLYERSLEATGRELFAIYILALIALGGIGVNIGIVGELLSPRPKPLLLTMYFAITGICLVLPVMTWLLDVHSRIPPRH